MSRKKKDDILGKFGIHIIDTDSPEYKYGITHEQAIKRRWRITLLIIIAIVLWFVPGVLVIRRNPEENVIGFLLVRALAAFGVFTGCPVVAGIWVLICKTGYRFEKWLARITLTESGAAQAEAKPVNWNDFFSVTMSALLAVMFVWGVKDPYFFRTIVSILNGRVLFY